MNTCIKFIYFKLIEGKYIPDRVADCHHLFNFDISELEMENYSTVKLEGPSMDVEVLISRIFPNDDDSLIAPDERENLPEITKGTSEYVE